MYRMSEKTKKNIEKTLGMSIEEFSDLSADDEKKWIENKTGHALFFSKKKKAWRVGRGNPLLARRKIRTASDLEARSRKIFGI